MSDRIQTFAEFWPYYLGEHRRPLCRALHFLGTSIYIGLTAFVIFTLPLSDWWMLLLAPIPAYALAWIGHYVIEKNRPATFSYPMWSLVSDFKMFGWMVMGRLWTGDLQHIVPVAAD